MTVFTHSGRHRVAVLVRPGLMPMELGIVHQLFGQATEPVGGRRLYEVVTCTPVPGEVRTDADFGITVDRGPQALAEADTVLVPAAKGDDEAWSGGRLTGPTADAFARIRPGARIASICTGAFLLAAAGLLDGRRATTHWKSAERFRRLFPRVDLDPGVLYADEGDLLTSAGEAAGIDLCLHMIRRDHGAAVAGDLARRTVVPPHREGGQAQYIRRPVAEPRRSSTGTARAWALEHLDSPLSLRALAERASMSVRTFSRRFREEVGLTPVQWLTRQRVELACRLLEETDDSVDRVASRAGFGTAASLRAHLHAALGVSPGAYRSTFRGPAARPSAVGAVSPSCGTSAGAGARPR